METVHPDQSPLAAYLEGQGSYESDIDEHDDARPSYTSALDACDPSNPPSFAPSFKLLPKPKVKRPRLPQLQVRQRPQRTLARAHDAWSTVWNSHVGRVDNANFIEHFRYTVVASQLLNEYLDHGAFNPNAHTTTTPGLDGPADASSASATSTSIYGAVATAAVALALVYVIQWARTRRGVSWSKSQIAFVLAVLAVAALVGYQYGRRQWLKSLRRNAVTTASDLTSNWQSFEVSSSSTLSFIQEVELVSKGYRLGTPLPPISRFEDGGSVRRCGRLRKALHKAYSTIIPACIEACTSLGNLIEEDDLDKYFDVYDISSQDAAEAAGVDALSVLEDDPESLKSLRVLSFRAGLLRRVTLCSLMALEADGGKPDIQRWKIATEVMRKVNQVVSASAEKLRQILSELEHFNLPITPVKNSHTPTREKMRSQVRKISALSSGIRGLQAKMQILREETNRSIEQADDLTDLGTTLMAQYESIGADLKELMQAWEAGKQSLQTNISRQERRISMASTASGLRSPVSSLGGLTAVEEVDGSPADALRVLNGDPSSKSSRSSMGTTSQSGDEEMVFEAVAMPKQRPRASTMTREERIAKMHEERERQATLRAKRDENTSMLRELESVINLRPKKTGANGSTRITSV
ncbi:hypothetical protein DOTSEDRAFT_75773 [Lecanosticta acicola]|uniref:Vezatin n=1 Tax=Lecanosticta acicola TaxID=111012 RepID=A0AAI8Z1N9_9PEZI|nr:hypothetical protein DOTSEDRAFT_75773 [Lecanosticta acicola]